MPGSRQASRECWESGREGQVYLSRLVEAVQVELADKGREVAVLEVPAHSQEHSGQTAAYALNGCIL